MMKKINFGVPQSESQLKYDIYCSNNHIETLQHGGIKTFPQKIVCLSHFFKFRFWQITAVKKQKKKRNTKYAEG